MGSISGIALREANGNVHKTSGLAQDISWFVNNIRLVNQDPEHIRRFLREYNFNGEDHQDLRPVGNGLVVVDMLKKQILRYQDVTGVGYLDGVIITEDARDMVIEWGRDPELDHNIKAAYQTTDEFADEYACVRFREFLDASRVKRVYDRSIPDSGSIQLTGMTIEEIDRSMKGKRLRFEFDMSPFEVISYTPRSSQGANELQAKLVELGFEASGSEKKAWETWVRGCTK